jgi:hypothetical protein
VHPWVYDVVEDPRPGSSIQCAQETAETIGERRAHWTRHRRPDSVPPRILPVRVPRLSHFCTTCKYLSSRLSVGPRCKISPSHRVMDVSWPSRGQLGVRRSPPPDVELTVHLHPSDPLTRFGVVFHPAWLPSLPCKASVRKFPRLKEGEDSGVGLLRPELECPLRVLDGWARRNANTETAGG